VHRVWKKGKVDVWSYCRYPRGIALCGRNLSYLHPPTIDEISKPIHLSDPEALEATVGIDAFLVASGRSITTTSSLLCPLSPSGGLAFVVES